MDAVEIREYLNKMPLEEFAALMIPMGQVDSQPATTSSGRIDDNLQIDSRAPKNKGKGTGKSSKKFGLEQASQLVDAYEPESDAESEPDQKPEENSEPDKKAEEESQESQLSQDSQESLIRDSAAMAAEVHQPLQVEDTKFSR